MNNRPRQHWQDTNDYTFNQYAFYLFVLGVLICGLIAFYVGRLWGTKPEVSYLVAITSEQRGDLPVIPFQNEDCTAFEKAFGKKSYLRYEFNDQASLAKNVFAPLKSDLQDASKIITAVVWLSAVGRVPENEAKANEKMPVIGTSTPGQFIELQTLIEQLSQLEVQNVILLLDCGHEFVNQNAYASQSNDNAETDFNPFSDRVRRWIEDHPEKTGKVQVIVNGNSGEPPLYSITRRRSLFGYALETILKAKAESESPKKWNPFDFSKQLDKLSLEFGGSSAPQVALLGKTTEKTTDKQEFYGLEAANATDDDESATKDPAIVQFGPDYLAIAKDLDQTWTVIEEIGNQFQKYRLPPVALDSASWQQSTLAAVNLSAVQLQTEGTFANDCASVQSDFENFKNDNLDRATVFSGKANLVPGDEDSEEVTQRREVADACLSTFDIRFRLPHYVAIADSLSWILPDNPYVENLRDKIIELIELYRWIQIQTAGFEYLNIDHPSLDHFSEIKKSSEKINTCDKELRNKLKEICRKVLPNMAGFQRDMAIEAFLRFPFLDTKTATADAGTSATEDSIFSRPELRNLLVSNPLNNDIRIERSVRIAESSRRIELYQKFRQSAAAQEDKSSVSPVSTVYAYRFLAPNFPIDTFDVTPKTLQAVIVLKNADTLQKGIFVEPIEQSGTPLDLGLEVKNAEVEIQCQIMNDDEGRYFRFFPNLNSRGKTYPSTEQPVLVALQNAPENGQDNPKCRLKVLIVDKNIAQNGKPKIYRQLEIPIRLPLQNSITLIVDVAGKTNEFKKDSIGDPIHPLANFENACNFKLLNNSHKKRTGTISLYSCASQENDRSGQVMIAGKIDQAIQNQTLQEIGANLNPLTPIATGTIVDLPAASDETASSQPVVWKAPPAAEGAPVPQPPPNASHGFLCVIKLESEQEAWNYWIPVFPVVKPIATVQPQVLPGGDVVLKIVRDPAVGFPRNEPIPISWMFAGNRIDAGDRRLTPHPDLDPEKEFDSILIAKDLSTKDKDLFLYVDVNRWPRKYVFRYNGAAFIEGTAKDAKFSVAMGGSDQKQPEDEFVEIDSVNSNFDRILGTRSSAKSLDVTLSLNVPYGGGNFSFTSASDYIDFFGDGKFKLYYPREIKNVVQVTESGTIIINSQVSDYQLRFNVKDDPLAIFEISPRLSLSGEPSVPLPAPGRGEDRRFGVKILFDREKPVLRDVRVLTDMPVFSGEPVKIHAAASDGDGVGVEWRNGGIGIYVSQRNGELQTPLGLNGPARKIIESTDDDTYVIKAPQETGTYSVGVLAKDRVGNEMTSGYRGSITVIEKPPPVPPAPVVEPTYELELTVVGDFGAPITEPELAIEPKIDPPARAQGGKFVYTLKGLKKGTAYTIRAKAKLTIGDKAELTGTLSYTPNLRPKDSAVLQLKR